MDPTQWAGVVDYSSTDSSASEPSKSHYGSIRPTSPHCTSTSPQARFPHGPLASHRDAIFANRKLNRPVFSNLSAQISLPSTLESKPRVVSDGTFPQFVFIGIDPPAAILARLRAALSALSARFLSATGGQVALERLTDPDAPPIGRRPGLGAQVELHLSLTRTSRIRPADADMVLSDLRAACALLRPFSLRVGAPVLLDNEDATKCFVALETERVRWDESTGHRPNETRRARHAPLPLFLPSFVPSFPHSLVSSFCHSVVLSFRRSSIRDVQSPELSGLFAAVHRVQSANGLLSYPPDGIPHISIATIPATHKHLLGDMLGPLRDLCSTEHPGEGTPAPSPTPPSANERRNDGAPSSSNEGRNDGAPPSADQGLLRWSIPVHDVICLIGDARHRAGLGPRVGRPAKKMRK